MISHQQLQAFLCGLLVSLQLSAAAAELTLERAVKLATANDPWIDGSRYRQEALEAQSVAAGALPDPVLSTAIANLPTDTLAFDQEPMTQFRVGLSQAFPRGDSRALKRTRLQQMSEEQTFQQQARNAQIATEVARQWLDIWEAQEKIRMIDAERQLFDNLVDTAQSSYVNSVGRVRQQDLLEAQLERTRLDDRLLNLRQQLEIAHSRLAQWLMRGEGDALVLESFTLPSDLPELALADYLDGAALPSREKLARRLGAHPAIRGVEQRLIASGTALELAKQDYQPEWSVNASYGYRDDDPMGMQRADFFSLGVSLDLPLFPAKRQDKKLQSAAAMMESVRTERALLLRQMLSELSANWSRLKRLDERQELYASRLLKTIQGQLATAQEAYGNDDGALSEVLRAKIELLNARVEQLSIAVERQQTLASINYFFVSAQQSGVSANEP